MRQATSAVLALFLSTAIGLAQERPGEGQLVARGGKPFALKNTSVRAEVSGPVARVIVRQTFQNPFPGPIEAIYVFPLPDQAAVDGLTIEIGDRKIKGEIQREATARAIYEKAKNSGKTAALLTQERPNVFTQNLANILPGEEITVELKYLEDVRYDKDGYTLVFPTVVGPRFHPPGQVADAARIPGRPDEYLKPKERSGHTLSLAVSLDANVALGGVTCPSHRTDIQKDRYGRTTISLHPADTIPNKDFVLRWRVAAKEPRAVLIPHRSGHKGFFTMMIVPEASAPASVIVPREVYLVVDCSGSMTGMPVETAKAVVRHTLRTLQPSDTFQILRFSEQASELSDKPLEATPENISKGLQFVDAMSGAGGTMMIEGIRAALAGRRNSERLRVVHFLTDGHIGNETQILEEVNFCLRGARIFPLGVGAAPNRYLIERLAHVGRGAASYVRQGASEEKIKQEVERFVERVRQPTLAHLDIEWGGLEVSDVLPLRIPDLFVGQPVVVHGKYRHAFNGTITLRGWRGGVYYEQAVDVSLPEREEANAAMAQLWARARIKELTLGHRRGENPWIKEEITNLALRHGLMSAYTAFVAVDEQVVVEKGVRKVVRQPLPLPEGTDYRGFFGTGTPKRTRVFGVGGRNAIGLGGGGGSAFGGRRGGRRNLRARGGGGRTQKAMDIGTCWLSQHQSPDGRWDCGGFMAHGDPSKGPLCDGKGAATHDVGVTGLALLTFLGAGHTHRDGQHKATVRKGLRWLKGTQDADGCFGPRGDSHFVYDHAIAALAMAEAYGMTKSGIWRGTAQAGIDFVMKCQNPYKAWRYGVRPGDNDVAVTGWMMMALHSARLAKLNTNDDSFRRGHDFINSMTDEKTGRTGYTTRGEKPVRAEGREEQFPRHLSESLTAVGMLARIFGGENPKQSRMLKAGAALLRQRLPEWKPASGHVDMYYWYFGTLAMFQMGGPDWAAWNKSIKSEIIAHQRRDGNFKGSWDPVGPWGQEGGRVYSTALMTMCMQVYYRYARVFGTR